MSEELVLPENCLRCGGPLDVRTFKALLRLNVPDSKARTEPVAFCPKCKITYYSGGIPHLKYTTFIKIQDDRRGRSY